MEIASVNSVSLLCQNTYRPTIRP